MLVHFLSTCTVSLFLLQETEESCICSTQMLYLISVMIFWHKFSDIIQWHCMLMFKECRVVNVCRYLVNWVFIKVVDGLSFFWQNSFYFLTSTKNYKSNDMQTLDNSVLCVVIMGDQFSVRINFYFLRPLKSTLLMTCKYLVGLVDYVVIGLFSYYICHNSLKSVRLMTFKYLVNSNHFIFNGLLWYCINHLLIVNIDCESHLVNLVDISG
jgi:hypothetical protein